jgi:competence protein ComGC
MPLRRYIQKVFTVMEILIVFAVVGLLLATTLPELLRPRTTLARV